MGHGRSYVQLHAHSSSSFDSRADPRKMVDRAVELGFTHLAITDHDRIEGVLRARDHAGDAEEVLEQMAGAVDYVETQNARAYRDANPKAAAFAEAHGLPGVAVADAHGLRELGVAGTVLPGDFSTASELLALLPRAELVAGRAPYYVRLWTPVARLINKVQGKGRVRPSARADDDTP